MLGDMTGRAFESLGYGWSGRLLELRRRFAVCKNGRSWLSGLGSEFE
jgi:hypothetical protein